MDGDRIVFFIFAVLTLIGYNLGWYGDITAILVLMAIGINHILSLLEKIKNK